MNYPIVCVGVGVRDSNVTMQCNELEMEVEAEMEIKKTCIIKHAWGFDQSACII